MTDYSFTGTDALFAAINNDNIEVVKTVINIENVNTVNSKGLTPLIIACIKQDLELLKLILTHKPNCDLKCSRGYTALMYACTYKDAEIVKLLIDNGCELNTYNGDIDILDFCSSIHIKELIYIQKNKNIKNNIKCQICKDHFESLGDTICSNCFDMEFNNKKISISPEELSKIKKKTKSPTNTNFVSPTNFVDISGKLHQSASKSLMLCVGCKNQRVMDKSNCEHCDRKSPLNR